MLFIKARDAYELYNIFIEWFLRIGCNVSNTIDRIGITNTINREDMNKIDFSWIFI